MRTGPLKTDVPVRPVVPPLCASGGASRPRVVTATVASVLGPVGGARLTVQLPGGLLLPLPVASSVLR